MSERPKQGFFARRWRGEVELRTLFWRDMVLVGTLVNLSFSTSALLVVANGAPLWTGVLLHFGTLPYNLFLFAAITRKAAPPLVVVASLAWLAIAILL
ncbi:hypothetical protein [Piscinibacter sakaiensis]|uniref:hypothetical protein n=1 Tax=Piscinibacter sakaiensis TaxID=1547922 RepID=UPI003AAE3389